MTEPLEDIFPDSPDNQWMDNLMRFSHQAMATVFEVVITQEEATYASQASQAAFEELDRIEEQLSRFIPGSDIAQLNALQAGQWIYVSQTTLDCLLQARQISQQTDGAFDVTVGPLFDCWHDADGFDLTPTDEQINTAKNQTGIHLIAFNEEDCAVGVHTDTVKIDLGGIGKGFAVDQMIAILRDWDIASALVHGGQSSIYAYGSGQADKGWPVTISNPKNPDKIVEILHLRNQALSGSGMLSKGFHVINPRTGYPVRDRITTWALAESAAQADALSTAFMIMSTQEIELLCRQHHQISALVALPEEDDCKFKMFGTGFTP